MAQLEVTTGGNPRQLDLTRYRVYAETEADL